MCSNIIKPHRQHCKQRMLYAGYCYRRHDVAWSVCLCVGRNREPSKNGWTDWDTIWDEDLHVPKEPCIRWGHVGVLCHGGNTGCHYYYCSSLFCVVFAVDLWFVGDFVLGVKCLISVCSVCHCLLVHFCLIFENTDFMVVRQFSAYCKLFYWLQSMVA